MLVGAGWSAVFVFLAGVQDATPEASGPGAVTVTCDRPELVVGKTLHVVRIRDPKSVGDVSTVGSPANLPPSHIRVDLPKSPRFSENGVCQLQLKKGRFRLDVLYRTKGTLVALTSGEFEIKEGESPAIILKSQAPRGLTISCGGQAFGITHAQFRVRGWRSSVRWNNRDTVHFIHQNLTVADGPTSIVLSPDQTYPVRILAKGNRDGHSTTLAWWGSIDSSETAVELSARELNEVSFEFQGSDDERSRIRLAELTVHLPENDTLRIPLKSGALLTNRRLIETSTLYETAAGDLLSFNRRSRVLRRKTELLWGGALKAKAYARITMSWNRETPRSLIWGAYLHTDHHDVLNTWEPPKKNAISSDTWEKDRKYNKIPLAKIGWKETLVRTDGGEMPKDPLWMTEKDVQEQFPDFNGLARIFKVRVAYRLNGEGVEQELSLSRWVTWKSKRLRIEAPPEWEGRARSYLDKSERVMDYCAPVAKYIPEGIQIFWTNNQMAGYTCGPKSLKRIQMGVFDLRRRQDLYTTLAIMAHEQLHAHGYGHGPEHDRLIRQANTWFQQHHQALADHPEYVPYPVTLVPEIESGPNDFGALKYKPNQKVSSVLVRTPAKPVRRGGLGLGLSSKRKKKTRAPLASTPKRPSTPSGDPIWLGVRVRKEGALLVVEEVLPFSPAAKAELEVGTRIFTIQGKVVTDAEAVRLLLKRVAPRGTVRMSILHQGREHSIDLRADRIRAGVTLGPDGF